MTLRWPLWAAASALAITLALYVAGLALGSARGPVEGVEPFSLADFLWPVPFVGFGVVGAVVAARRHTNPIGWLFLGTAAVMLFNFFTHEYALTAFGSSLQLRGRDLMAWLALWTWVPAIGLLACFFLLFPTGRLPSRRWRWPLRGILAVQLAVPVAALRISPSLGADLLRAANPGELPQGEWLDRLANSAAAPLMLISIASLVVRFWRARGVERQQLKWLSFAGALFALTLIVMIAFGGENPIGVPALAIANTVALVTLPVAAGLSILKYRLYDIDLVINRTLVYGGLSAVLAGTYLAIVVVLQLVLEPLTAESDLAVAASTLAVAALFRPLRTRVQAFIDRRFYRRRYDAARTLNGFSARLREEVDLDALSGELVGVVRATMQPAHASLWLRNTEVRG